METAKIRVVLSKMTFPETIQLSSFETIRNVPKFIEYSLSENSNYDSNNNYCYERLEELVAIMLGRHYTRLKMHMNDEQKLNRCRDLWHNHKLGIALPIEYTVAKYDFLDDQHILNLTADEKKIIFAQAQSDYIAELENIVSYSTRFSDISKAKVLLMKIEKDELDKNEKKVLVNLAKILSIKRFLDNCENVF